MMIGPTVIISPCRNEARFIRKTLESMIKQTRRPGRWIIVDDASTDFSAEIIAGYCKNHPWIELVQRKREGGRQHGPGVVSAFNHGYALIGDDDFDFIVKMDCDIEFEPDCIEKTLRHFEDEKVTSPPKLISGDDVISTFGISPGPKIGKILELVREAQAAGEISSREEALAYIQDYLLSKII